VLKITDDVDTLEQDYDIHVINVNDAPVITSIPVITIPEDSIYSYEVIAGDPDGDNLAYDLK
jgi:hypothetical protein